MGVAEVVGEEAGAAVMQEGEGEVVDLVAEFGGEGGEEVGEAVGGLVGDGRWRVTVARSMAACRAWRCRIVDGV